ncbi:MAG: hypothetical protein QOE14_1061, partial [Humisphaera sp.]|nr:hypothetical protein [Humisphaera sp.]
MAFGFRFGKKGEPVPEWAPFFTRAQFESFVNQLGAYFHRARSKMKFDDTAVPRITVSGGTFPQGRYGIVNLAQVCNQVPAEEWPQRIADHFDSIVAAAKDHERFNVRESQFDQMKEMLAVRIGDEASLPTDKLLFRRNLPGTISYLVFDLPNSVESVPLEIPEKWGKTLAELFEIGLANVKRSANPEIERVEIETGVSFTAYSGESFFTASFALLLDQLDNAVGPHGTLVAIPHRHTLLLHRIENINMIKAVQRLGILAVNLDEQGPGSISPCLFWYRGGIFIDLPFRIEGDTLHFRPPDEFMKMLKELPAGNERPSPLESP